MRPRSAPALAALVLLALLAAAPPAARAGPELADQVRDLGSEDSSVRVAAMNALRGAKDPRAIPLILEALPGFDLTGRYYAVLVLDACEPKLAQPAFRSLIGSEDPWLRLAGATALLAQGDRRALPVVVEALRAEGVPTLARNYMLNRLHLVADPGILPPLREMLAPGEDASLLGSVVNLLHQRRDEGAVPAFRKLLSADDRPGVKAMAAAWLYAMGEAERAGTLADLIRGGDLGSSEFLRVKTILVAGKTLDPAVLDALTDLLETDASAWVLTRAVEVLARFRHRAAAAGIRRHLGSKDRYLSRAAFDALAEMGEVPDEAELEALLDSEEPDVRLRAADALRRMDVHVGFSAVVAVLREGTELQRRDAAEALGGFRIPDAVPPLLDALLDPGLSVRSQARTSLAGVLSTLFPYRRLDLASAGYDWSGPEAARKDAVEAIRKWWAANREKDW